MKKILSILLAIVFALSMAILPASAKSTYVIDSPYKDVVWSGEGAWKSYKGNLHTHSYVSDAEVDYKDMIEEYYNQGYEFLAMTDHGVTGKEWNEKPTQLPLYLYQKIIGNFTTWLTDDEYEAIQNGSYPLADGTARGYGMTCVPGGNELNALTITKDHVNGMFLPAGVGDNYLGYENDYEGAVKLADEAGGYSFINHPGDWLHSNRDKAALSDPENVHYFADILLRYDSCLGMEVFNEKNSVTPHDRILWDNLLMECLPYGKNVIAFSNSDAHYIRDVDSSFCEFMMEENTLDNIKETMINGNFFCTTRIIRAEENLGPQEEIDARNTGLPYPEFTEVSVDGHKVTVKVKNASLVNWVADGQVIAEKTLTESADVATYTIDLDKIDGAEDFQYIRCQLFGQGGCTLTQALVIDDGTEPLEYEVDTSAKAKLATFWHKFTSLRIFVLIQVIIDAIKY